MKPALLTDLAKELALEQRGLGVYSVPGQTA